MLAENERSRIIVICGFQDSLGHTFAMLECHTDLALQLFQMSAYPQVEKGIKRNSPDRVRTPMKFSENHRGKSEIKDP